jgi:hypothetical protein
MARSADLINFRWRRARQAELLCDDRLNLGLEEVVIGETHLHRFWKVGQIGFGRIMKKAFQLEAGWESVRNVNAMLRHRVEIGALRTGRSSKARAQCPRCTLLGTRIERVKLLSRECA